jgi:hypothetical protein
MRFSWLDHVPGQFGASSRMVASDGWNISPQVLPAATAILTCEATNHPHWGPGAPG